MNKEEIKILKDKYYEDVDNLCRRYFFSGGDLLDEFVGMFIDLRHQELKSLIKRLQTIDEKITNLENRGEKDE